MQAHLSLMAAVQPYILTLWSRVLLEKLTGFHLIKKFPAFYRTRRFITAFTRASVLTFRKNIRFYGEELLAPRSIPKLEDHPLPAVRDCLFNMSAATLPILEAVPPSANRGRATP